VPALDDVDFLRTNFPESVIIYWIHGISAIYNKEYLKHINKIDYLWSPTKTVYKKITEQLHPVPFLAEFQLIPNWAEPFFDSCDERMVSAVRLKHKISNHSKVFIFCGGDVKLKGWFLMKRALKQFAQKNKTCITVLVAGGNALEDEIYSNEVRVIYAGTLEPRSLSAYYAVAEFGLFPSLGGYEHAPVTLIEMIKCNVLPIVSDVGGIREMLGEEYPFLIDSPHSVNLWTEAIEKVIALKKEEKNIQLTGLQQRMKRYQKKDFTQLISDILLRRN